MVGQKRKRAKGNGAAKPPTKRFKKGYDRTSGTYGRYNGSNPELKFKDVDIDDAVIAGPTGTIVASSVNLIDEGTGEEQRIGRKYTIKKIAWRYQIRQPPVANATGSSDTVRVILYLDKQCNGTAATAAMILEHDDFQSFRLLENSARFTILMDRTYDINSPGAAGNGTANDALPVVMNDTFYKDCNITIQANGPDGTLAEIRSNNIGVLLFGAGTGTCAFLSHLRLRFSDGN